MHKSLAGQSVAILLANGFNEIEMTTFLRAMLEAGAIPKIISTESSLAHGWQDKTWGHYHPVDKSLSDALAADYDMLFVPGGYRSHDKLKSTAHTRRFINGFMMAYKPVLALGDAVKLMADIGVLNGMMVYGTVEVKESLAAGGAIWSEISPTIHSNVMSAAFDAVNRVELIETFANFVDGLGAESENDEQQAA